MTPTSEKFTESKPRKGAVIHYKGVRQGAVSEVDGNLCWVTYDEPSQHMNLESGPFIWRFNDGLNVLHDWPTKQVS